MIFDTKDVSSGEIEELYDIKCYNYINSAVVFNNFDMLFPLGEEKAAIEQQIQYKRPYMPIRIQDDLSFSDIAKIHLNAPDLRGLYIEEEYMRSYPLKEKTAHLIGYISLFSNKDVKKEDDDIKLNIPGYRIGRTGIESKFEDILKGQMGQKKVEVNAFGHSVRTLSEIPPVKGQDITLSIDSQLQEYAYNAMGEQAGAVVVVDIHSGDVLALVSTPSFNPNLFTKPISTKNWNTIIENEKKPLQNRAIMGLYSPGSIFKLFVGLAGLETGILKATDKVNCTGKTTIGNQIFHCWKRNGHGPLDFQEAITHSCDVFFYELAQKIGLNPILKVANQFGFGQKTNIALNGEASGLLPNEKWKQSTHNDDWRTGDTINLSIGQGYLIATPLQMAMAVAQIVNGGKKIAPQLIKNNNQSDTTFQSLNIKPYILKLLTNAMNKVVNDTEGTAYRSRFTDKNTSFGGKTASTQVRRISLSEREKGITAQMDLPWKYRDHGMFAGFAPVDNPKYAIIVVAEHGGGGSSVAAPIAAKILKKTLELDIK